MRKRWSKVGRITGAPGNAVEGETVAEGSAVARKAGNAAGAKGPYCSYSSGRMGGRGALTKAPIHLQDQATEDLRSGEGDKRDTARLQRRLITRLESLGLRVTVEPLPQAA